MIRVLILFAGISIIIITIIIGNVIRQQCHMFNIAISYPLRKNHKASRNCDKILSTLDMMSTL